MALGKAACPYEATHGNPFRYCECGWTEPACGALLVAQPEGAVRCTLHDGHSGRHSAEVRWED